MNIKVANAKDIKLDSEFSKIISETTYKDENLAYRPISLVGDSISKGSFLVAVDESGKTLGWIEKYKIWDNWWGLSTLYVFPEYRNSGIGRGLLIPAGVKYLQGKNIFAATTNLEIQLVLEKLGFKKVTLSKLPLMVRINLVLTRYLNFKSLLKLIKVKSKGFVYFVRIAK